MTWHVIINRHQMMTCYVASCPPAARRALLTPAAPCCQLLGARARGFRSPCGRTAGAPRGDECPRRGGGRDRGGRARSEVTLGRQRHHQSARRWAPCCLPPRTCPQPPAARCAPVAGTQMRSPRRCRPRSRPSRQSPPAGLLPQATSHRRSAARCTPPGRRWAPSRRVFWTTWAARAPRSAACCCSLSRRACCLPPPWWTPAGRSPGSTLYCNTPPSPPSSIDGYLRVASIVVVDIVTATAATAKAAATPRGARLPG